ncbi:MAG: hypothetical protein LBQ31_06295, partial [Bacteroidales bacterium]|nr:hypothetical protein [Bacteroidales bacterium]
MKTKIFFALFSLFVTVGGFSHAQQEYDDAPWCPTGATWWYSIYSDPFYIDFIRLVYEKDSIVQGTSVKTIGVYSEGWYNDYDYQRHGWYWSRSSSAKHAEEYLYEQNDSVFRYDKSDERFVFLYSWNFKVGDTFVGRNMTTITMHIIEEGEYPIDLPSDKFVVLNVTDKSYIGGKIFKEFNVQSVGGVLNLNPIISKIGSIHNPFPYPVYSQSQYYLGICVLPDTGFFIKEYYNGGMMYYYDLGLVCYSDSIRGNYIRSNFIDGMEITPYCINADTLIVVGNENAAARKQNASLYKLYPNPVYDEVCISAE